MDMEKLKSIIINWDPIDLISVGCPNDEYDLEVNKISKICTETKAGKNELALTIYNVFLEMFGDDIFTKNIDECIEIAEKYYRN